MPRIRNPISKKCRLNLETSQATRDLIEDLRIRTEADSLSEVIRRSLAVYDALLREKADPTGRLLVRYTNGTEKTIVLIP